MSYFAEYAKSNRSRCQEFRCKGLIEKGSLRIGIHLCNGEQMRTEFFHPQCLWETFQYRTKTNPKIKSMEEISGLDRLNPGDVQIFQDLIDSSKKRKSEAAAASVKKSKSFIDGLAEDYRAKIQQQKEDAENAVLKGENPNSAAWEAKTVAPDAANSNEVGSLIAETPIDPKHELAVALYGKYHKKKVDELKEYLRWNRQLVTGTKKLLLHRVIDGDMNGRLALCPVDGGKLKFNEEHTGFICTGYWDEDNMVRVPCNTYYSLEGVPRVRPWFDRKPTDEETAALDRLEAIARGEEAKYAETGDDSELGKLMEKAEAELILDFATKESIKASIQSVFTFLEESKVQMPKEKKEVLFKDVGTLVMSHKGETPAQLVKSLVTEFQKGAHKAKLAAKGSRTYIDCPYEEKDEAKALGAKWDKNWKKWFVPGGKDISKFSKWLPKHGHGK